MYLWSTVAYLVDILEDWRDGRSQLPVVKHTWIQITGCSAVHLFKLLYSTKGPPFTCLHCSRVTMLETSEAADLEILRKSQQSQSLQKCEVMDEGVSIGLQQKKRTSCQLRIKHSDCLSINSNSCDLLLVKSLDS